MSEAVVTPQLSTRKQATSQEASFRRMLCVAAFVCAGYYLTAKIGFTFALQPGSVSTLWMPNAILLATLLLVPMRLWWIVVLAACPAHFAAELQSGIPATMVLSWFISNTLQALIGAALVCHFVKGPLRFDSFQGLALFLIFAACLAPFISSFIDLGFVRLNRQQISLYWETWRIRFLSNVLATMILVPVITTWANSGIKATLKARPLRWLEAIVLFVGLIIVGQAVFTSSHAVAVDTPSLLYWPLPFLLWATVRFGPRGISTLLLFVMFLAIFGATQGKGPFVAHSSVDNAVSIQWFLIVISIPLLSLAAVIAERKQANEALGESEARVARAEAFSFVMLTHVALDGTWIKVPPQLCDLLGYSEEELLGQSFKAVTHPDDFDADWNQCQRLIRGEIKSFDLEKRYLHKNGKTIWVYLNCSVVEDDAGTPVHFITYIKEITDRKVAEQAVQEINTRNRAILRALPDMMFLHTTEGVYLDYYARDPDALKVPPEKFLGKNFREILPPEVVAKVEPRLKLLESSDDPQVVEYTLEFLGEERYYEARLVKAEADNVLSIVRDITETRRVTDSLRRGEEKLLQSNRQIRSLAARLITVQESERRRIAVLLHDDLSQNIATLGVAVSRLKRKLPDAGEQVTSELDEIASHINDLTTQIRKLSHQLHPEVLEHVGLVSALEAHVAEFRHNEGIEARFFPDIGANPIPLDVAESIYRVAFEALRNVARHSGAQSATVSLSEADGYLTLEVSDSGQGFDVERTKRGSGIGLISAEERVRILQGIFEIKSTANGGTTLIARIPLAR